MPAELSVPITSRENIQNGGKEGDLTIQSEPGLALKALRQLETAFNEFLSANLKTGQCGELASSRVTILRTLHSARGLADCIDSVFVKHVTGANSTLGFKSYDQGRERWQGETLDFVWFDEEPPLDVYTEGLTRTNATGGMVYMTFTPLLGMSDVVMMFLQECGIGT
jgi:phage terminase large subunit-like protein